jgi:plasmid maintenance system antidote protein VapI
VGAYFTVESSSTPYRLTFGTLQDGLIRALKVKLNNGEFTERGLARLTGISQPQVHNLLKGARKLSPESADIILEALHLSVLDLLTPADLRAWQSNANSMTPSPHPVAEPSNQALFGPEYSPRKNPARSLPARFELNHQAS